MNVLWRKLWHDLWERKSRTLLVVMSVAAGVFCVGAIFGMNDQLYTQMDISHASTYPSHINMFTFQYLDQDMADQLSKIDFVEIFGVATNDGASTQFFQKLSNMMQKCLICACHIQNTSN